MLQLRPYQTEAIDAVQQAERDGIHSVLISLPTGTGKTVVFSHLAKLRGGRTLVLVHRDELVRQAVDKLHQVWPDAWVGVVKANENECLAQVVVGSVQTLARPRRLAQVGDFDLIIVDEAHHAIAESYREVLTKLGAGERAMLVGVTATPRRSDKVGLGAAFQKIVYDRSILDMIRAHYLCDLRGKTIETQMDISDVRMRMGEFVESDLDRAINRDELNATVVDAYLKESPGRQAIAFAVSVAHAKALAAAFRDKGVATEAVYGDMLDETRKEVLAKFHRRELQVVSNCQILTEGFDEPAVSTILMARPTKSEGLFVQMVGRGTRPFPGKEDCLILDFAGNTGKHTLVTLATLFGLKPKHRKKAEVSILEAVDRQERAAAGAAKGAATRAANWKAKEVDLFGKPGEAAKPKTPFRWQTVDGIMVLPSGEDGRIFLLEQDGAWIAKLLRRGGAFESLMDRPMDVGYAQGIAEDWVREHGAMALVATNAKWRKGPASERQIELLHRYGLTHTPETTKGQASDLLDNYFALKDLKRFGPAKTKEAL